MPPAGQGRRHLSGDCGATRAFCADLCNPPFHASLAEASKGTERKLRNLGKAATAKPVLNFGGQKAELWCEGGRWPFCEHDHSEQGIRQPVPLVQLAGVKKENLPAARQGLSRVGARQVRVLEMARATRSAGSWLGLSKTRRPANSGGCQWRTITPELAEAGRRQGACRWYAPVFWGASVASLGRCPAPMTIVFPLVAPGLAPAC